MTNFVQIPFVLETTVPVEEKTTKTERSVVIPVKEAALSVAVRAGSRGNATVFSTRTGGASVASPQTNEKGAVPFWLQEGGYTLTFSGGNPTVGSVSVDWDAVGGSGVGFVGAEIITASNLATDVKATLASLAPKAEVTTVKGELTTSINNVQGQVNQLAAQLGGLKITVGSGAVGWTTGEANGIITHGLGKTPKFANATLVEGGSIFFGTVPLGARALNATNFEFIWQAQPGVNIPNGVSLFNWMAIG